MEPTTVYHVDTVRRARSGDRYRDATVALQQTTKWVVGAFGAAGALVVAGISLGDIGRMEPWTVGFSLGVGGSVVAPLAVVLVIHAATRVLAVPIQEIDSAVARPSRRRQARASLKVLGFEIPIEQDVLDGSAADVDTGSHARGQREQVAKWTPTQGNDSG